MDVGALEVGSDQTQVGASHQSPGWSGQPQEAPGGHWGAERVLSTFSALILAAPAELLMVASLRSPELRCDCPNARSWTEPPPP